MRNLLLLWSFVFLASFVVAQTVADAPALSGLPTGHHWRNNPADWFAKDGVLTIKSGPKTDWFISPIDGQISASSSLMLFPAAKEFSVSAKVTVDFLAQWDAGVLAIYADEKNWVKFCSKRPSSRSRRLSRWSRADSLTTARTCRFQAIRSI